MPKGATTTGRGQNLMAWVMFWNCADGDLDLVPLLFLDGEQELHEVGADGEVGGVAGDDEGFEVADGVGRGLEGLGDERDDVAAEGVHLGVEFDGGDAVAEVDEGGAGVLFDDAVGLLEGGERDGAGRCRDGLVGSGGGVEELAAAGGLGGVAVPGGILVGAGVEEPGDVFRDGQPEELHLVRGGTGAGGVHHFEGAELPVEAGVHGLVDLDDGGGGFAGGGGDAVGGVGEELGEEGPVERCGLIFFGVAVEELVDAGGGGLDVFGHLDRGKFGAGGGLVVEGLPVEDVAEVAAFLILAGLLVEAAADLVAEQLLFEHGADEGGKGDVGTFVVDACGLGLEVAGDVGEDVDADEVAEAEGAGAGPAEGAPVRASTSSMVRPWAIMRRMALPMEKVPMRLAMKLGVSREGTMVLPRR